jgi:hypothetical protein
MIRHVPTGEPVKSPFLPRIRAEYWFSDVFGSFLPRILRNRCAAKLDHKWLFSAILRGCAAELPILP